MRFNTTYRCNIQVFFDDNRFIQISSIGITNFDNFFRCHLFITQKFRQTTDDIFFIFSVFSNSQIIYGYLIAGVIGYQHYTIAGGNVTTCCSNGQQTTPLCICTGCVIFIFHQLHPAKLGKQNTNHKHHRYRIHAGKLFHLTALSILQHIHSFLAKVLQYNYTKNNTKLFLFVQCVKMIKRRIEKRAKHNIIHSVSNGYHHQSDTF